MSANKNKLSVFCYLDATGLPEYFREYTKNTSLHGIKYIGETKRTKWEKLCWFVLFGLAVIFCSIHVVKTYNKWKDTPVIVTFSHSPTPISQIPFPAVTICPETKIKQTKYNISYYTKKIQDKTATRDEVEVFENLRQFCHITLKYKSNENTSDGIINFLKKASPSLEETFTICFWNKNLINCTDIFQPVVTEDGLCYTFNKFENNKFYQAEVSDTKDAPQSVGNFFPQRTRSSGGKTGLQIVMHALTNDLDYLCGGHVKGFKVILHEPGEVASDTNFYRVPLNQDVAISVNPELITTSSRLENYSPDTRRCYFQHERQLKFYQHYAQENCQLECLTNATLKACGCVAFYMPKTTAVPYCGLKKYDCMSEVQGRLHENYNQQCNCYPSCYSLTYNAEVSQANFHWKQYLEAHVSTFNTTTPTVEDFYKNFQFAYTSIFFKKNQFIGIERNELYGITDFLANCGGIFGLFTGFSLLSLLEIVYYLTLRLAVNKIKFGKFFTPTP